jgi:FkbM family methyltransferase
MNKEAVIISSKILYFSNVYNQNLIMYPDYLYNYMEKHNKLWDEDICQVIVEYIKPDTDFIDIGANYGLVSLGVKKLLKDLNRENELKNIHLFECNIDLMDCLQFNFNESNNKINNTNYIIYPFGLSNKNEMCNMCINNYNQGCNFIKNIYDCSTNEMLSVKHFYDTNIIQNNICFPTLPLDNFYKMFSNKVSVIKIDVECMEYKVLQGAKDLLIEHKPTLIIEIWKEHFESTNTFLNSINFYIIKEIKNISSSTIDYVYQYRE